MSHLVAPAVCALPPDMLDRRAKTYRRRSSMDPSAAGAAAPTGLVGWIIANGQIVAFIAQILFWLVLGAASVWAAATFNRYVNFVMRGSAIADVPDDEEALSVEEFVE
jgi:hypothetical protein